MRVHANASLSPRGRLVLCRRVEEEGWTLRAAAEAAGLSVRSAGKWLARYRCEGEAGLCDRPSTPRSIPHRRPEDRVEAIAVLRGLRMTGAEIAECLGMALSTVSAILVRIGLGKLSRLEPPEPPNRYERSRPGELVHIDVKKWAASWPRGTASRAPGLRRRRPVANASGSVSPAGNSCTSVSTTRPGWPMSKCSQTSARRQRSRS
jgi:transposase